MFNDYVWINRGKRDTYKKARRGGRRSTPAGPREAAPLGKGRLYVGNVARSAHWPEAWPQCSQVSAWGGSSTCQGTAVTLRQRRQANTNSTIIVTSTLIIDGSPAEADWLKRPRRRPREEAPEAGKTHPRARGCGRNGKTGRRLIVKSTDPRDCDEKLHSQWRIPIELSLNS